jgi:hypothetical protein
MRATLVTFSSISIALAYSQEAPLHREGRSLVAGIAAVRKLKHEQK